MNTRIALEQAVAQNPTEKGPACALVDFLYEECGHTYRQAVHFVARLRYHTRGAKELAEAINLIDDTSVFYDAIMSSIWVSCDLNNGFPANTCIVMGSRPPQFTYRVEQTGNRFMRRVDVTVGARWVITLVQDLHVYAAEVALGLKRDTCKA